MEPVISANDYTLPPQSQPCYEAAFSVREEKCLSKQTIAILTLRCFWTKKNTPEQKGKRKAEAAPRLPLRGLYVLEPFGILWRRKGRNEGGLPLKEADLSSLLAPTQETRMLRVRTTHVSLQFIISWGRYQLPRRQLSIARDPDIKPHCDCSLNKDYHLTLNLIMLREMESTSKKR